MQKIAFEKFVVLGWHLDHEVCVGWFNEILRTYVGSDDFLVAELKIEFGVNAD